MDELDQLKATIRKLTNRAVQAKMDLHDLSEELPTNWQRISEVAQSTFAAYRALHEAREALLVAEGTCLHA